MPLQELNDGKVTTIHELGCCMKKPQHFVEVVRRIGSRKWRSCEESASGSGIHCDKASAKSGGHVKSRLLEVEFTVVKRLLKVEVM